MINIMRGFFMPFINITDNIEVTLSFLYGHTIDGILFALVSNKRTKIYRFINE